MTVTELIKILQLCPGEAEIIVGDCEFSPEGIQKIELDKRYNQLIISSPHSETYEPESNIIWGHN